MYESKLNLYSALDVENAYKFAGAFSFFMLPARNLLKIPIHNTYKNWNLFRRRKQCKKSKRSTFVLAKKCGIK